MTVTTTTTTTTTTAAADAAAMIQAESVTTAHLNGGGAIDVAEIPGKDQPPLLFLHGDGDGEIVAVFADVLGQTWAAAGSLDEAKTAASPVLGLRSSLAAAHWGTWDRSRIVINTHCVDGPKNSQITSSFWNSCSYWIFLWSLRKGL